MIQFLTRLFAGLEPVISAADPGQAAGLAALHAAGFRRGWSETEFEALLLDRNVVAQSAHAGRDLIGFIMSRLAVGEAEILSVAVAKAYRGKGVAGRLLDWHLRTLAGHGVQTVFLEVDAANQPARRLYSGRMFREAGARQGYYPGAAGAAATALILRRELGYPANGRESASSL
jgi:[ribosomal protein S18]-alanine N-acetyltransferase